MVITVITVIMKKILHKKILCVCALEHYYRYYHQLMEKLMEKLMVIILSQWVLALVFITVN